MSTLTEKEIREIVERLPSLKKPSAPSAEAPSKTAGQVGSLSCDALVGGGPRPRRKSSLLLAHLGMMAAICGGLPPGLTGRSREPREKTAEELERIAAAEAKRERKRLRKEPAKTTAPNEKLTDAGPDAPGLA